MTDGYLFAGITAGSIGIIALMMFVGGRRRITLSDVTRMFLSCAGLSVGVRVCELAIWGPCGAGNATYVFLGGVAVIWSSAETIWTMLRDGR